MRICVLDPGLRTHRGEPSKNLGDLIIESSVRREVLALGDPSEVAWLSTKEPLGREQHRIIRESSIAIVGGSNLLSPRWALRRPDRNQWAVGLVDALYLRKAVLLGVGWRTYSDRADRKTALFLRTLLHRHRPQSVRDSYTWRRLTECGIGNAMNTHCVTMWTLSKEHLAQIPAKKSSRALVCLTDYATSPKNDRDLLVEVSSAYDRVFAWPQGEGDRSYLETLGFDGEILPWSYQALEEFVNQDGHFDYVGTRLHCGIRCLQSGRRALVIEVDNRAAEVAADTGLHSVRRGDLESVRRWIQNPVHVELRMDYRSIQSWREGILSRR